MRIDRIVIGAVVLLGTGLGLIFGYCNGTVGFNTGYPFSGTSLHFDVTTTGLPVLIGVPLVAIGLALLFAALILSIVAQFRGVKSQRRAEPPSKPLESFEE
jgi:hypothetical protein